MHYIVPSIWQIVLGLSASCIDAFSCSDRNLQRSGTLVELILRKKRTTTSTPLPPHKHQLLHQTLPLSTLTTLTQDVKDLRIIVLSACLFLLPEDTTHMERTLVVVRDMDYDELTGAALTCAMIKYSRGARHLRAHIAQYIDRWDSAIPLRPFLEETYRVREAQTMTTLGVFRSASNGVRRNSAK